jgi:acyl dehydratase
MRVEQQLPGQSMQDTPQPTTLLQYEDFEVRKTVPFGKRTVTKDDILRFARAYDPQPFHLSEEAAKASNVGRLIASGYHTCCILMRMASDGLLGGPNALGSPGLDEVKFLKPVFPGDDLAGRCTCLSKRELKSKPGVGLLHCIMELVNQRGEVVISWDLMVFRRMSGKG